jgi:hypothetical protein
MNANTYQLLPCGLPQVADYRALVASAWFKSIEEYSDAFLPSKCCRAERIPREVGEGSAAPMESPVGIPLRLWSGNVRTPRPSGNQQPGVEEAPPKVVNLMEALRQSLERVSTTKKRAAKIVENEPEKAVAKTPGRRRARG